MFIELKLFRGKGSMKPLIDPASCVTSPTVFKCEPTLPSAQVPSAQVAGEEHMGTHAFDVESSTFSPRRVLRIYPRRKVRHLSLGVKV
jgi:hypothetical protein